MLRKSSYRIPEYLIASDVAISLGQVKEVGRPRITRGDGGDTKQSENAVLHFSLHLASAIPKGLATSVSSIPGVEGQLDKLGQ